MKSGVISIAILVTALAVILPFARGLQCYSCAHTTAKPDSSRPPEPDPDPPIHENCPKGSLPDSFLQTCTVNNTRHASRKGDFACFKAIQPDIRSRTGGTSTIKGCDIPEVPIDNKADKCEVRNEEYREPGSSNVSIPITITVCYCHGDKCNGAIAVGPVALQALVAAAVAPIILYSVGF